MLAFSSASDFNIRLPSPDVGQTRLHLLVTVRDTLDCVTSVNLTTVTVTVDVASISQLVDQISSTPSALTSNPLVRLLSSGNQNTVAQLITSLSQHFNHIDEQNVADALSSIRNTLSLFPEEFSPLCLDGLPFASISVSSLASATYPQVVC